MADIQFSMEVELNVLEQLNLKKISGLNADKHHHSTDLKGMSKRWKAKSITSGFFQAPVTITYWLKHLFLRHKKIYDINNDV